MKVMILCGGQGTRLREETEFRPKPLVEVGGRPILWHIMKLYAHHGQSEFVLCLGYRGNMIKEHFLNYEAMNKDFTVSFGQKHDIEYHGSHEESGFRVTLADTGLDTLTGARIRRAMKYVSDDSFMVTYGDGLSDVNIREVLNFHHAHGRLATMTTVRPVSRYGVLEMDSAGLVSGFHEKPQLDGWVNVGFFVFDRRVEQYLGGEWMLEDEPLRRLAADGQLMAFRHDGFFYAMDTFRELKALNEIWDGGHAPWKVWE